MSHLIKPYLESDLFKYIFISMALDKPTATEIFPDKNRVERCS